MQGQRISDLTDQDERHERELESHSRQWKEKLAEAVADAGKKTEEAVARAGKEAEERLRAKVIIDCTNMVSVHRVR